MAFVRTTFAGGIKTKNELNYVDYTSSNKNFELYTDYPAASGGNEEYPTPFGTFCASYTACQASYLRHYCDEHGLDYKDVIIELELETLDDEKIVDENGRTHIQYGEEISKFKTHVTFPQDFPAAHIEGALDAMNNCKIAKNIRDFNPTFEHSFSTQS